jgi:hypothetical protein
VVTITSINLINTLNNDIQQKTQRFSLRISKQQRETGFSKSDFLDALIDFPPLEEHIQQS